MIRESVVCIVFLFGVCLCVQLKEKDSELVLVHVLFRHGARTTYKFYPTDPHINSTFYPYGLGGLTNEGKVGEYKLGQFLRQEYGDFLDDIYSDDSIYVRSTGTTRTIMSAQLVLAGLFPPKGEQIWHSELAWQPIPVYVKEKKDEDLLGPVECEYRRFTLSDLPNRPEVYERFIEPHKTLFSYISKHSGLEIKNLVDLLEFYFIVSTEDEMNLPLPDWVKEIYPEPLISSAANVYAYWNYDSELAKINIGYLLKKMLDDSLAKINRTLENKTRKMFMYSGHESTLGYLFNVLNAVKPHIPPYGSAILLEVRQDRENNYYFQVKYHTDLKSKPQVLIMPGCSHLCPVHDFKELYKKALPSKNFKEACHWTISKRPYSSS